MLNEDSIVYICIGSNKIVGDCLGPLVGTYLKNIFNAKVYGDMENPINFYNADFIMQQINKNHSECLKVIVDSALGKNVGDIVIDDGVVEIGKGLNKRKKIYGDISIKAVVCKNYYDNIRNLIELRRKNIEEINDIAVDVIKIICNV